MKKLLLTFSAVFVLVASASAQETYSITLGGSTSNRASVVGQTEAGRLLNNYTVCQRAGLALTCTQAQACAALNVPGGASCTAAQALAMGPPARIYPDSLAGREAYSANSMIRYKAPVNVIELEAFEGAICKARCLSLTVAEKNARCADAGLPNGCNPCW